MRNQAFIKIEDEEVAQLNWHLQQGVQVPTRGLGEMGCYPALFPDGHMVEVVLNNTEKGVEVETVLTSPEGEIYQIDHVGPIHDLNNGITMRTKAKNFEVKPSQKLDVGDKVRVFDSIGADSNYHDGIIVDINKPPQAIVPGGIGNYFFIQTTNRVICGQDVPFCPGLIYRPVRGSSFLLSSGHRVDAFLVHKM